MHRWMAITYFLHDFLEAIKFPSWVLQRKQRTITYNEYQSHPDYHDEMLHNFCHNFCN